MKRPSFQFYPGDWLRHPGLRAVSIAARGLWVDLLCLMHSCEPYGHLALNGKSMTDGQAARSVGLPLKVYRQNLAELEEAGVSSRTEDGRLYSRRMVRDERLRVTRAAGGKLGGNPRLKVGRKVGGKVNLPPNLEGNLGDDTKVNQKPTPSSSSSTTEGSLLRNPPSPRAPPPLEGGSGARPPTATELEARANLFREAAGLP